MAIDVEALFRAQASYLRSALQRRYPHVAAALIEDACGEAWAIAWRYRDTIEPIDPFGWVFVVARHELYALARRRGREVLDNAAKATGTAAVDGDPDLVFEARAALRVLGSLKANQRHALALRIAGLSYREIAELEGKTYTWVNRHVNEGRRALARLLEAEMA